MRCNDCRFWSDRLAMSIGGDPIQAYCLVSDGPFSGRYMTGNQGCDSGKSNQHGAVDTRGVEAWIEKAYAKDDARAEGKAMISLFLKPGAFNV